jgi:hypothetical protein
MKTRLAIFAIAVLLLPPAGLFLSGTGLSPLSISPPAGDDSIPATLRTTIMLLLYVLLINHTIKRLTGSGPLESGRAYFIRVSIASALTGWLLSYLNLFAASWTVPQNHTFILQILLYTPLFALLVPAVLVTRDLFGSFPGLRNSLIFRRALPDIGLTARVRTLAAVAILGLTGGAVWPAHLFWLFWMSPLALLLALQLSWQEKTIFSGAQSGSRLVFSALSGIFIGNLAVITYQSNAYLQINLPNMMAAQAGLALFGLLCLQLGDLLAQESNPLSSQPESVAVIRKS